MCVSRICARLHRLRFSMYKSLDLNGELCLLTGFLAVFTAQSGFPCLLCQPWLAALRFRHGRAAHLRSLSTYSLWTKQILPAQTAPWTQR